MEELTKQTESNEILDDNRETTTHQGIDQNALEIRNAISEQTTVNKETERLDRIDVLREQLGLAPLMNANELPLSNIGKYIFDKRQAGEAFSLRENIMAGRDSVFKGESIQGMTIKPDHAYRGIDAETLKKYIKTGSVEGSSPTPDVWSPTEGGNGGVDWYLGGFAPKYGNIAIETPADPESFKIADQESTSLMAKNPFVRHIKSEGGTEKSIPMSKVTAYKISNNEGKLSAQKINLDTFIEETDVEPTPDPKS